MLIYNHKLAGLSRELRKNMTDAERHLWSKLRMRQVGGYQFYRQRIIGDYIVDFFCPRARLVVEVDGGQHSSDAVKSVDENKAQYLASKGLKVIRFNDIEVLKNVDGVLEGILENIGTLDSSLEKNPP